MDTGWISPECLGCYMERWKKREKYLNKQPVSDMEIRQYYMASTCGDTNKMSDVYKYDKLDHGEWKNVEIDISDTANKIRARWRNGLH